jgi:hypothetical protein
VSLFAYWATVADQAILSLCIQIMLTWIVLRALKSSSAGFCRDRLCKIRRAPRRAQRFGGDGLTLRRGSGRDAAVVKHLPNKIAGQGSGEVSGVRHPRVISHLTAFASLRNWP